MPYEFYPIDVESASFGAMREAVNEVPEPLLKQIRSGAIRLPVSIDELPDQDMFYQRLNVNAAVALGLQIATSEMSFSRHIVVQEHLQFKQFEDDKQRVLYGVGIRWIVDVNVLDTRANLSNLPMVVASAEFGYAQASIKFEVRGLSSAQVTAAVPVPTQLNVEKYAEYSNALKIIKSLMFEKETKVTPDIVAINAKEKKHQYPALTDGLAASWALACISRGKPLSAALNHPMPGDRFKEVIRAVYVDVAGISEFDLRPDDGVRRHATQMLGGLKVVN